jgi:ADP-dependent NAD(P)H-hydrate dehydratase
VLPAEARAVTPGLLRDWPLDEPGQAGDKHSRGTVLVVGGAVSTPGALLLAGLAALRAGAGRLSMATVQETAVALAVALPEAAVQGLPAGPGGSLSGACAEQVAEACAGADAVVLGPGLLGKADARDLLAALLHRVEGAAFVLDAVALTAVAGSPELLAPLGGRLVLTPNSGELAALRDGEEGTGPEAVLDAARRYGAVVAARGLVATPDGRLWHDEAGDAGLGTSGSGDVLAGLVGGLLARGAEPAQAAVWGQYLHAAAGDRLAGRLGRLGFLARELLDEVPAVLTAMRA